MLNIVFEERVVRGRGRGRGHGHKWGFSWHTQGVVTGMRKMASYFTGRGVAPPDVGLRSPSDGSAFRCPVGGVVKNPSLSPPPTPLAPSYLAQGRPREVWACPVFPSASLTERRNCVLGWARSGKESLLVSLGVSRLRPALWTAGWLSGPEHIVLRRGGTSIFHNQK